MGHVGSKGSRTLQDRPVKKKLAKVLGGESRQSSIEGVNAIDSVKGPQQEQFNKQFALYVINEQYC